MAVNNNYKKIGSIPRLKRAVIVSLNGLKEAWKGEEAFRQEVCVAVIFVPVAFFVPVSLALQLLMAGSLFLVLAVELLNSAIEAAIDLMTEEEHPLAKNAKDMGSAAVLMCLILAVLVWSAVLISCVMDPVS
ncbi:MAG: diacylglycerol kinase [bacterium]